MTTNSLNVHVQPTQHGSPSGLLAPSGTAGGSDLGFLNANHVRHEPSAGLTGMFSGMFSAVKEYFWPASLPTLAHANHALADRTIAIAVDVESTGGFNPDPMPMPIKAVDIHMPSPLNALRSLPQQPG